MFTFRGEKIADVWVLGDLKGLEKQLKRAELAAHRPSRYRAQSLPQQRIRRAFLGGASGGWIALYPAIPITARKRWWSSRERYRSGGAELSEGDYLFTEPGEEHDVVALSDAVIFVSSQKATPLVDPSVDSGAFRLRSTHPTTTAIVANCPRNLSG